MSYLLFAIALILGAYAFLRVWRRLQEVETELASVKSRALAVAGTVGASEPRLVAVTPTAMPARAPDSETEAHDPDVPPMPKRPFISVVPKQPTKEEQLAKDLPIIVAAAAYYMAGVAKPIRVYAPAQTSNLWGAVGRFDQRRGLRVSWDRVYQPVAAASGEKRHWYKFW